RTTCAARRAPRRKRQRRGCARSGRAGGQSQPREATGRLESRLTQRSDLQYPSGKPGGWTMQTKKSRYRWATLTLLIVLITAAAVWCGRDRADWHEATSATGDYV